MTRTAKLDETTAKPKTTRKIATKTPSKAAPQEADVSESSSGPEKTSRSNALMVRSVEKAFRMLEAFDPLHPTMSLTQITSLLDIDKSEAQRFAHTLVELGYLRKDPINKSLQPTVKSLVLARNFLHSNSVLRSAAPYLTQLNKLTEETVNLAVLENTDIVFVQRISSGHVFNPEVVIGARMPAYCTSLGLAMLSRLPEEEALHILRRSDLKPHTPTTTYTIPELMEKLRVTREQGYAITNREFYNDISIGAAVVNPRGEPVLGISLAVSPSRISVEEAERTLAQMVVDAARAIPV